MAGMQKSNNLQIISSVSLIVIRLTWLKILSILLVGLRDISFGNTPEEFAAPMTGVFLVS